MSSTAPAAAARTAAEAEDTSPGQQQQQQKRSADGGDESSAKRQKGGDDIVSPPRPAPLYLFATTTDVQARRGASRDHWSRTQCLTLREMLGKTEKNVGFFLYIITTCATSHKFKINAP